MKKDKLITIRVSEETRDKFNQWCEVNDIKGSSFLSDIINGCIDGSISHNMARQSIDNTASQKIAELENTVNYLSSQLNTQEESLYDKLSKSIYRTVNQKIVQLEDKVNSLSSVDNNLKQKIAGLEDRVSQLESLDNKIDKSIEQPTIVETETAELEVAKEKAVIIAKTENKPITDDSRGSKAKEEANSEVPQQLIDIPSGEEISQSKLAKLIGKGTGTMSRWANGAKSRPEWFDIYIEIRREKRKGKNIKVMYRR